MPGARAVAKRGPAGPIAREAAALRLLAGDDGVPRLLAHRPGVLLSTLLPGAPRPLAALGDEPLAALGRLVRRLHEARCAPAGALPHWPDLATDLDGYRRRRAEDAARLLGPGPDADRARALGAVPGPPAAPRPFRLLHGDLVEANVVWHGDVPRLVDWEFWRMGDGAEDLAYLAELNDLGEPALAAVLDGYGDAGAAARVPRWRALVALDACAWYRAAGREAEARRLLARGRVH